jgi:hypothetical protein
MTKTVGNFGLMSMGDGSWARAGHSPITAAAAKIAVSLFMASVP